MGFVLPLELITKFFEGLTEDIGIARLWLSCRNVSKSWRIAAEEVFREKHLPKMRITIHLCKNLPLPSRPVEIGYTFSRFADDARDVAIFSDTYKFCDLAPDQKRTIRRGWKSTRLDNWSAPPQHVELRKVVNDTELPGFRYDKRTIEVHCEWKGMVQALLSEDRLSYALVQKRLDISNFPWANDTRNVGDIPTDQLATIMAILSSTLSNVAQNKRHYDTEARRKRIRKQYEREGRKEPWIPDEDQEKIIMDALDEARKKVFWQEYSDDEAETRKDMANAMARRDARVEADTLWEILACDVIDEESEESGSFDEDEDGADEDDGEDEVDDEVPEEEV